MSEPVMLPPIAVAPLPVAVTVAASGAAVQTATLDGAAQALAALTAPATFSGTVVAGPTEGALALLTAFGSFPIASATPLALGAQLTLQLPAAPNPAAGGDVTGSQPGTVTIVAIDGAPVIPPATIASTSTASTSTIVTSTATSTTTIAPAPPIFIDLGTQVMATVIAAAAPVVGATPPIPTGGTSLPAILAPPMPASPQDAALPAPTAPAPPAAVPSTMATAGSATSSAPPLPDPATAMAPSQPGASPPASGAAPTAVPLPAAPPAATLGARPLPAGTSLVLRIAAVQTAGISDDDAAPPPALTGTLRSGGAAGALVATAIGTVRLTPAPSLPPGTRVALRLLSDATPSVTLAALPDEPHAAARPTPSVLSATAPAASAQAPGGAEEMPVPASAPVPAPATATPGAEDTSGRDTSTAGAAASGAAFATAPAASPGTPIGTPVYRLFLAAGGTAAAPSSNAAVIGTVLPEQGQVPMASLVETPFGILAVTPRLALPPGTLLLLEPQDVPFAPSLAGPTRQLALAKAWPALAASLDTLGRAAPDLAARLQADLSAQGGDKLAAALIFIVATLRGNAGASWPGGAVEHALALAGRDDLARQLGEDFGELRGIAAAPATTPWQVFVLPLVDAGAVRPVRLYLKKKGERRPNGRGEEENTRFVLEFELTRLGAMQLDGFLRRHRFDLALRTRAPLAPALRVAVTRIFQDRIAASGLAGEIDFATVARFDIAPLDALRGHVGLAV